MESILERFLDTLGFDLVLSLTAASLGVAGAFLGILSKSTFDWEERSDTVAFEATEDLRADSRLDDLTKEFDRNRVVARWSSTATTLLTFSQFIVGGVLASSFIQEALSASIVGLLGVLVLLSSLIHQRYRPDLHALQAKHRMYKARKLIRLVEDDLFAITNGMKNAPTIFEVREKASRGLSELEDIEIEGSSKIAAETASGETSNNAST